MHGRGLQKLDHFKGPTRMLPYLSIASIVLQVSRLASLVGFTSAPFLFPRSATSMGGSNPIANRNFTGVVICSIPRGYAWLRISVRGAVFSAVPDGDTEFQNGGCVVVSGRPPHSRLSCALDLHEGDEPDAPELAKHPRRVATFKRRGTCPLTEKLIQFFPDFSHPRRLEVVAEATEPSSRSRIPP